jgi:acetyl esterase/lipase
MAESAFHPDLQSIARRLPRGLGRPATRWLLGGILRLAGGAFGFPKERVDLGDGASVFVARSGDGPRPTLVWIHGGGLLFGDPRQDADFLRRVATMLEMNIVSVGYRFAVEHPFPAALDDCVRAWRWAVAQDWVDPARVVLGGASAGGGLAAAVAQRLVQEGGVQPVLQLLVYPMLDDRSSDAATVPDARLRTWDRASNRYGWDSYLAGHDRRAPPPFAVPGRAEDLPGLPPAWIGVGTFDLFHEEDLAYARRLEAAGIRVEVEEVEGAFHGFETMAPEATVSRWFVGQQLEAMRKAIRGEA